MSTIADNPSGSLLDLIVIEIPCTKSWDEMAGDNRSRFCSDCQLQVYDISEMTRGEAESLIVKHEGKRLCARFYRRPDGTVLTRDCFSVRRAARRAAARTVAQVAGLVLGIVGWATWALASSRFREEPPRPRDLEPFRTVLNWLDPPAPPVLPGAMRVTMGGACAPPQRLPVSTTGN
jgi:hypothetical protein